MEFEWSGWDFRMYTFAGSFGMNSWCRYRWLLLNEHEQFEWRWILIGLHEKFGWWWDIIDMLNDGMQLCWQWYVEWWVFGKGIRYPNLCFVSTRQTEQATQSTQALGNQKGILEFPLLILHRICRKMRGMTEMTMDLRRENDMTIEW